MSARPGGPRSLGGTIAGLALAAAGCGLAAPPAEDPAAASDIEARLEQYTPVRLAPDLSALSDAERRMLPLLIEAARAMDRSFWKQAYGDRSELMASLEDPKLRRYAEINYGPWDRLEEDAPFVEGVPEKPKGARFYPEDMTREELEAAAADDPALTSLYTLVRRDEQGRLVAVPYSEAYAEEYGTAAAKLRQAAELAPSADLKRYLEARAADLLDDDYTESDLAWMDMEDNRLDVVIGPIETYEDKLFGYKAASTAHVLIKDLEWSARLERYGKASPTLEADLARLAEAGIPVDIVYEQGLEVLGL